MTYENRPFEVEKTFGMGVLLKLTKKNVDGVEISTDGEKFTSNLTFDELSQAVDTTLRSHNIQLKVK